MARLSKKKEECKQNYKRSNFNNNGGTRNLRCYGIGIGSSFPKARRAEVVAKIKPGEGTESRGPSSSSSSSAVVHAGTTI
ncbi:unnamed protein product [Linum trigynum]|uniref:Uncharacterized protein n=1 Tax=Linum trigynum TaxID=586398 RepID=A0AAV2GN59_9ROSI